ncbi:MAG: GNAT family N-acetyltransferase [Phycisphaerae bacterium]|nr:GNAT family N-acetyltransferase [Phycisphaerae bacterium]
MTDEIIIQDLRKEDLAALAELYEDGIPHAIFCALGKKFIARFFGWLAEREDICSLVGLGGDGQVQGVIVGTLHRSESYSSVLKQHRLSLLAAAGWRLLSPRVLVWIIRGMTERLKRHGDELDLPDAELLLIAVRSNARGTGVAYRLVQSMESRFRCMGLVGEYAILTEADNVSANRFYERIGANLVGKGYHHRLLINRYRKVIDTLASREKES